MKMKHNMLSEIDSKDADIEGLAQKALQDKGLLSELLDGLTSKKETFRYNCFKALMLISGKHGELLYSKWDYFVELLGSTNSYQKMSAILLIANLVKVDKESRFENIFDQYYSLLDDKSMIVAIYTAGNSGKIVQAKPGLENKITNKLFSIDETHHKQDRKDLIKSGAIESFIEYFSLVDDKKKIIEFVTEQLHCQSPKTRKMAREFLQKMEAIKA